MIAGAVPSTRSRGGSNGGNAENLPWSTRERARHQNGTYEAHWCCQRKESGRGSLTGRGEEKQCKRPKTGISKISSRLQRWIQIDRGLMTSEV